VVRADVSGLPTVHPADEAFFGALMDRPDVTLVVKGLAEGLAPHLWSEPYLRARCGGLTVHKASTFDSASPLCSHYALQTCSSIRKCPQCTHDEEHSLPLSLSMCVCVSFARCAPSTAPRP